MGRKSLRKKYSRILFPVTFMCFQLLTHRFTEVSVFDKATHVLGVRDFTLIKELKLDWQVATRGWRRVTPADINRVRPTIGEKPVSTDVTSPSKMKKQFI